jgi:hypothetical protein
VCHSKIVYGKEGKSPYEYSFINNCRVKADSEFCLTKLGENFVLF